MQKFSSPTLMKFVLGAILEHVFLLGRIQEERLIERVIYITPY